MDKLSCLYIYIYLLGFPIVSLRCSKHIIPIMNYVFNNNTGMPRHSELTKNPEILEGCKRTIYISIILWNPEYIKGFIKKKSHM